jgi:hypothetical protein
MINPATIAGGVAIGVAAERTNKFVAQVLEDEQEQFPTYKQVLEQIAQYTRLTAEALNTNLTHNLNIPLQLFPYPAYWPIPEHNRKHLAIFFPSGISGTPGAYTPTLTSIKIYFQVAGVGAHTKTLSPGWTLLDLPPNTEISTADGNTYSCILSFRDDAIGTAL